MTPEELLKEFSECFGIHIKALNSKLRSNRITGIKQLYCYIGKNYYNYKVVDIGKYIGALDHSTVSYSIAKIANYLNVNDEVTVTNFNAIKDRLELRTYAELLQENKELREKIKKYE